MHIPSKPIQRTSQLGSEPYHFKLGNFAFLHHLIWVKKRILVGSDKKTSPNSVSDLEIEVKVEIMYSWQS